MELLVAQCDLGPRPPGSEALGELRTMILEAADEQGLRAVAPVLRGGQPPDRRDRSRLCNLVVSIGPAGRRSLWAGRPLRHPADRRPGSGSRPARRTHPGRRQRRGQRGGGPAAPDRDPRCEPAPGRCGPDLLRRRGLRAHRSPPDLLPGQPAVGRHGRGFRQPPGRRTLPGSHRAGHGGAAGPVDSPGGLLATLRARSCWTEVFARAAELGLDAFVPEPGPAVFDDHVPFLEAGFPPST